MYTSVVLNMQFYTYYTPGFGTRYVSLCKKNCLSFSFLLIKTANHVTASSQVLYDIGVVSTKEPFKCVINQGIILGEVQYTAWKDQEGNYVSADTEERLNEYQQVTIPEDKV